MGSWGALGIRRVVPIVIAVSLLRPGVVRGAAPAPVEPEPVGPSAREPTDGRVEPSTLESPVGMPEQPPVGMPEQPPVGMPEQPPVAAPEQSSSPPVDTGPIASPDVAPPPPSPTPDLASDEENPLAEEDPYDPRVDSPEAHRARSRIRGGTIALTLGLVLGLGAIALAASDPCAMAAGNGCNERSRNRAAVTIGLPGIALVGSGVVLLGLGGAERRRIHATFMASRTEAVLGFTGRF